MDQILCFVIYMIAAVARLIKPFSCPARPFSKRPRVKYSEQTPGRPQNEQTPGRPQYGQAPGKPIKILLVGYNGARNTGSDVRTAAIARQLKTLFGPDEIRITVMTLDPGTMEGYFDKDVELLKFSSFFPLDILRACSAHHAVILCEGSTLKSTFANALTLMHCEVAGIMAAQHKPCIAYGAEVGAMDPFLERAVRRLCRHTYFIARSEDSLEALKRLGLKGHAGTDAAWFYDGAVSPAEAERLLRNQGWDGKKPLLGIAVIDPFCWPVRPSLLRWLRGNLRKAVSGHHDKRESVSGHHDRGESIPGQYDRWYFFTDSPGRLKAFRRYLREIAAGVNRFLEKHDFYPVVIGMERLDAKACSRLREELSCPGAMFLSGEHPAGEMTGVLRRLSMLVTSRYHAAVLSMENGCPLIAVSMDERLDGLMKEIFTDKSSRSHTKDKSFLFHTADKALGRKICNAMEEAYAGKEKIREKILRQTGRNREEIVRMGEFLHSYLLNILH